jgi:collagenase-like PrtC family protease
MIFSIPSRWDLGLLKKQVKIIKEPFEVYDSLRVLGPFGSGRSRENLPKVSLAKAKKYSKKCQELGVHLNYVFNAPTDKKIDQLLAEGMGEQLKTILDLEPKSLTISELSIMEYVHDEYPDIPIDISTIAGIDTLEKLKKFLHLPIRKVVLPQQFNREIRGIKKMLKYASEHNIEVEILANETCLHRCPIRRDHYLSAGGEGTFKKECTEQFNCVKQKIEQPYLLLLSDWIRPEDISFYENLGVNRFKLSCRTKSSGWQVETLKAYVSRSYQGNLIQIMGITPPNLKIHPHKLIYLNNSALDGFLAGLLTSKDRVRYCQEKIIDLYKNGKYKIDKKIGGEYKITPAGLVLDAKGKYFKCQSCVYTID